MLTCRYNPAIMHLMRWLYTDMAIIAPPLRLEVLDTRLRFELALLEFHMHFGEQKFQERCASLRKDMHEFLRSDRKGNPPPKFFLWLLNMYTGQQLFQEDQSLQEGAKYREGVSMEGDSLLSHFPSTSNFHDAETGADGSSVLAGMS